MLKDSVNSFVRVSRMNWDVKLDVNKIAFHRFPFENAQIVCFEITSCVYTKTIILFNLGE